MQPTSYYQARIHFTYEGLPYTVRFMLDFNEAEMLISDDEAIQILHDRLSLDMEKIVLTNWAVGE